MGLGTGAVVGGAILSWLILPCPRIICLSPVFKSLVLGVRLVGGVFGYMVNILSFSHKLISNSFSIYPGVTFAGSM